MTRKISLLIFLCAWGLTQIAEAATKIDVNTTLAACMACHDISKAKKTLVGPPLFGVYGRKPTAAGLPFKKLDDKALDTWLSDPSKTKAETQMAFKVTDKAERAKVIAALKSLK